MNKMPIFRTQFDGVKHEGMTDFGESLTQQQFAEDANINNIMAKALRTGYMPVIADREQYGDFSNIATFHEAQNAIAEASEAFMQIPPEIRIKFDNDPAKLIDFLGNEKNRPEAEKMGILKPAEIIAIAKEEPQKKGEKAQ